MSKHGVEHSQFKRVVLGLGSNIDPIKHLRWALAEIKKINEVKVLSVASIYESDALLPDQAPNHWNKKYLNSAVEIVVSGFKPFELLQQLKAVEHKLGRIESDRWAPRKIDIDILWAEDFYLKHESLNIPHAQLLHRPFALLPLLELCPDIDVDLPDWIFNSPRPFNTEISKHFVWPKIAGILNVTEDSFSGDGVVTEPLKQLGQLLNQGADIIDIGAESTRPGALLIDSEIEYQRLASTLDCVLKYKKDYSCEFEISIDSRKPEVMERLLSHYHIDYLNDVEGFRQPQMRNLLKLTTAKAICMHSFSVPPLKNETISDTEDAWDYLIKWWERQKDIFAEEDISSDRLIFDPGIGFGKTPQQSIDLLNALDRFSVIREEIYLGYSRKSFLSLLTDKPASERDPETALVTEAINLAYAQYIRVHNVAQNKQALIERTKL